MEAVNGAELALFPLVFFAYVSSGDNDTANDNDNDLFSYDNK